MQRRIQEEKAELRQQIKARYRQVASAALHEESEAIWRKIEQLPVFQQAQTILFFHSLPDEPHTHEVMQRWSREKTLLLPAVKGDALELRELRKGGELVEGAFGIKEPAVHVFTDLAAVDVAIVPGVAFDAQNYRLGRGKGYYDRLLGCEAFSAFCIGVCFSYQRVATLPTEPHDLPMDQVIDGTEVDN